MLDSPFRRHVTVCSTLYGLCVASCQMGDETTAGPGPSESPAETSDADDEDAGQAETGDDATGPSDTGSDAGDSADTSGSGTGSTESTSTSENPELASLYPLRVGAWWRYRITADEGADQFCSPGEWTSTVEDEAPHEDGGSTFLKSGVCSTERWHYYATADQVRYRSAMSDTTPWSVFLDLPPEAGHVWEPIPGGPATFEWQPVESVTVPAGTFDNCWLRATHNGALAAADWVFCPEVGLVHVFGDVGSVGTFQAELLSFEL
ncbi:MAG: hypothetical protein B7733_25630 [Myxococcales bacterium FL481]|nr:MAG: hypothetical protein B7733_25630 [Myxococcales bacterium FL481]